jgi:hypothetical protein
MLLVHCGRLLRLGAWVSRPVMADDYYHAARAYEVGAGQTAVSRPRQWRELWSRAGLPGLSGYPYCACPSYPNTR